MGLYAVIKGDIVDGIAIADGPLDTDGMWICVDSVEPKPASGWRYSGGVFSPPPLPPPLPNIISKLAMIDRFTEAEYEGVLAAARSDVQVQGWLDRFASANKIDLDNSRTIDGINLLVSKNLLAQDRANTILTAPVQAGERVA